MPVAVSTGATARTLGSIRTTASQAIASPRPIGPTCSPVLALTLTADSGEAEQPGEVGPDRRLVRRRASGSWAWIDHVAVDRPPARARRPGRRPRASSRPLSSPSHCGSVSGKCSPMSPRAAAPSRASATACSTTSASECPSRPRSVVDPHARPGSAAAPRPADACRARSPPALVHPPADSIAPMTGSYRFPPRMTIPHVGRPRGTGRTGPPGDLPQA